MRYKGSNETEANKAKEYLTYLITNGKTFDLTEKRAKRTYSQNNYIHLILSYWGLYFGYTLQETKQEVLKKAVCPDLFYEGKKNGVVDVEKWRSTADLNTAEMSIVTDRFRRFSDDLGLWLPEPKDLAYLREIENELERYESKLYI